MYILVFLTSLIKHIQERLRLALGIQTDKHIVITCNFYIPKIMSKTHETGLSLEFCPELYLTRLTPQPTFGPSLYMYTSQYRALRRLICTGVYEYDNSIL